MNRLRTTVQAFRQKHPWLFRFIIVVVVYQTWQTVRLIPTFSERKIVQALTKNMQTHCVGRYLIDLPADSKLFSAEYYIDGINFSISRTTTSEESAKELLSQEVASYAKKYREEEHFYLKTPLYVRELKLGEHSKSFLRFKDKFAESGHIIESFIPVKNHIVHVWTISYEGNEEKDIAGVKEFLPRLAKLESSSPPSQGYCAGEVIAKGIFERETADVSWIISGHPDVSIQLATDTYRDPEEEGLLSRMNGVKGMMMRLVPGHRVLRSGSREVNDIDGEEWLGWARLEDHAEHRFEWETTSSTASAKLPEIRFKLETGQRNQQDTHPKEPSLSDSEAIGLFEAVVDSIRLRPGAI